MSLFHPIFSVLIKKPDLVVEHVSAYVALVKDESESMGIHAVQRAAAWAVVLISASVFLTLAGVAVMLGAMLDRFHWALIAVPGAVFLLAIVAAILARKPMPSNGFAEVRKQIDADLTALRAAGSDS